MTEPRLDPADRATLEADADLPPFTDIPVAEGRERFRREVVTGAAPEPVATVDDRVLAAARGPIGLRCYRPADGVLPLVVYFHGGGWTIGDLDTHDSVCRRIANACGAVVLSVDYRLAPEHPYPTAVDDSYLATAWAALHASELGVDPLRIAVAGDSSGAANAAVVSLLARDRGFPSLATQALIYPVTDAPSDSSPSYVERGAGYALDAPTMHWFWRQYVGELDDLDLDDPYLCPLRADDLSELPPGFVLTTEFDPLRDEGREYAQRLRAAGNQVTSHHVPDLMHGFVERAGAVPRAAEELAWVCEQIGRGLAGRAL